MKLPKDREEEKEKKPIKISEEVIRRRDESLKKFLDRKKGANSSKELKANLSKDRREKILSVDKLEIIDKPIDRPKPIK